MATVYLGAARGDHGFRQLVAIKRPHAHLVEDADFRATLLTEARLAANVHHANVVDVRDVEAVGDSIQLVMDYVEGAALGDLIVAWSNGGPRVPPAVAVRIALDACAGLHAAHELRGDDGRTLGLVHRDVSPQNVLVGTDGIARLTDFGIAKCVETSKNETTRGTLKGKLGYMAPEYVRGQAIDRRADVFALGVVLWESLAGKRLFRGSNDAETIDRVQHAPIPRVSEIADVGNALDDVVARALARDRDARFATAEAFGATLQDAARAAALVATAADVGAHVRSVAGDEIERRRAAARDAKPIAIDEPTSAALAATRVDVPRPRTQRTGIAIAAGVGVVAILAIGGATLLRTAASDARDPAPSASAPASSSPASSSAVSTTPAPSTSTAASAAARASSSDAPPAPSSDAPRPPVRFGKPPAPTAPATTTSRRLPPNPYPPQ